MAGEKDKHQVRFTKIDWSRISERAEREGMDRGQMLLKAFNAYDDRAREHTTLADIARAKPLSTGEDIIAYMTIARGDEDAARVTMRATREEWAKAIDIVPGLRAEIDRRWGKKVAS